MLAGLIERLRSELRARHEGYVQRAEELLGQILVLDDPGCIAPLLQLFEDDAEYDELMFSIIHTIERFDDPIYVRFVAENLGPFLAASPRWAIILQMRILNSQSTLAAYADCVRALPKDEQDVVRQALGAVRQKDGNFGTRCDSILKREGCRES